MVAASIHEQTVVCRPEDDTRISRPSESKNRSGEDVPDFSVSGPELQGFVEDTHRQMRRGKGPHAALVGALRRLQPA